jgi:hypothetical protein
VTKAKQPQQTPQIVPMSFGELVPYARNARTHSDEQVAQLAASLREFGWTNPVLVDAEGGIIAGHGRVMAARKLAAAGVKIPNWPDAEQVPTIALGHLTKAQRRAYVLADNQLATRAGWDFEVLAVELDELRDEGVDLSLLGWEQSELNDLIGTPNTGPDPSEYSSKIEAPTYTPKGEKPEVSALFNREKLDALLAQIAEAEISPQEAQFLTMAAARHVVFDYHQIAEFYCHASPQVQTLMEASALVIIDFDKAIEGGYVQLSKRLAEIYSATEDEDEDEEVGA